MKMAVMANGATQRIKKKKLTNSHRGNRNVWLFVNSFMTSFFGKYQPTKMLSRTPPIGIIIFAEIKSTKSKKVIPNKKRTSFSGPKLKAHSVPSAIQDNVTTLVAARRWRPARSIKNAVTGSCRLIILVSAANNSNK